MSSGYVSGFTAALFLWIALLIVWLAARKFNLSDYFKRWHQEMVAKSEAAKKKAAGKIPRRPFPPLRESSPLAPEEPQRTEVKFTPTEDELPKREPEKEAPHAPTNYSGQTLVMADLSHRDLRKANFQGANLTMADLSHSDLRDANLSHCNLTMADLSKTDLRGANMSGANMTMADLSHSKR